MNLHGSTNYANKYNKGIGDIFTYIYQDENQPNSNTWYILDGTGARPKWDQSLYTNFGDDYRLGENSELSLNYQYSIRHTGRAAHYKYDTYFSNSSDGASIVGTLYELFNPNDVHRKCTFQNFNVDYRLKRDDNSSFIASSLYENSNLEQTIENKEFENGNSLELGAKSQNIRLDGIYEYDTVNMNNGAFEGYDNFNNTIDLKRDVYAGYVDYSGTSNNLSYILGLRAEYLDQKMDVSSTRYFKEVYNVFGAIGRDFNETEFRQNKFDLFPWVRIA